MKSIRGKQCLELYKESSSWTPEEGDGQYYHCYMIYLFMCFEEVIALTLSCETCKHCTPLPY
jgi:hypothetical protein